MSRFTNIAAAAIAGALVTLSAASVASARSVDPNGTVYDGAWQQKTAGLRCEDPQQGSTDGGRILVVVSGLEMRKQFGQFQTDSITTQWVASKWINGDWVPLLAGPVRYGYLGTVHLGADHMYRGPFTWSHFRNMTHPSFKAGVDTNGTWRLDVASTVYQEDGVPVAYLDNTTGTCTFAG